ncbi:MAG: hypothetical protein KDA72_15535, partial [Planctomycetales bacterium]|nr:hypothetical protein [Planctomycetales bacterium]
MRMLSGRMHWLTVGLALLVSAQGFATKRLHGQAPYAGAAGSMPSGMPPGMMPGGGAMPGGMMMPDRPMSMAFKGPPPMDVVYAGGQGPATGGGCMSCGGGACGGYGCAAPGGEGLLGRGPLSRLGGGCGLC